LLFVRGEVLETPRDGIEQTLMAWIVDRGAERELLAIEHEPGLPLTPWPNNEHLPDSQGSTRMQAEADP